MRLPPHKLLSVAATATLCAASGAIAQSNLDWVPRATETLLNTNQTTLIATDGTAVNVTGGIFQFRNVTIPANRIVRGVGSRPMIWIVSGTFTIEGSLSADGGDGDQANTLNSANFPTPGGIGVCGGGDGGDGSPNRRDRSFVGGTGIDGRTLLPTGGRGGMLECRPGPQGSGSGGGGGAFGTFGDPWYRLDGGSFLQLSGVGGAGTRGLNGSNLPGGQPGTSPFCDGVDANNFIGRAFDINLQRPILGELNLLRGGQGGGGGGDQSNSCTIGDPLFANDGRGGGGGAGGGCIVIFAAGDVVIGAQGRLSANGGNGGGGEQAGSSNEGGGGGGGSGGLIVVAAGGTVDLNTDGLTYADDDSNFAISADGGVGQQSAFQGPGLGSKYSYSASTARQSSAGGFGGLGIIQIMARPGNNAADGTNTVLDDNIRVFQNGQLQSGNAKQRVLAWRGWPNANGAPVDDMGQPTLVGTNGGDMRPSPILMPLF